MPVFQVFLVKDLHNEFLKFSNIECYFEIRATEWNTFKLEHMHILPHIEKL
jgi:hypothetical protein